MSACVALVVSVTTDSRFGPSKPTPTWTVARSAGRKVSKLPWTVIVVPVMPPILAPSGGAEGPPILRRGHPDLAGEVVAQERGGGEARAGRDRLDGEVALLQQLAGAVQALGEDRK